MLQHNFIYKLIAIEFISDETIQEQQRQHSHDITEEETKEEEEGRVFN